MAHTVQFTTHAAERLSQRFGATMRTGVSVDISDAFEPAGFAYRHNSTGHMIQNFVARDRSVRLVLTVDMDTGSVITVMTEGPVVDAVYRAKAH